MGNKPTYIRFTLREKIHVEIASFNHKLLFEIYAKYVELTQGNIPEMKDEQIDNHAILLPKFCEHCGNQHWMGTVVEFMEARHPEFREIIECGAYDLPGPHLAYESKNSLLFTNSKQGQTGTCHKKI